MPNVVNEELEIPICGLFMENWESKILTKRGMLLDSQNVGVEVSYVVKAVLGEDSFTLYQIDLLSRSLMKRLQGRVYGLTIVLVSTGKEC